MSHVWKHSSQSGGALLVHLAIADHADDEGYCFPSIAALAEKSRLKRRAVQYAIQDMIKKGELEIVEMGGIKGEERRANTYRLIMQIHTHTDANERIQTHTRAKNARVQIKTSTRANKDTGPVHPNAPQSSVEPSMEPPTNGAGSKKLPTSYPAIQIAQLFNRRLTTEWSDKEIKAFRKISFKTEEEICDLALVCDYTRAQREINGIHRRDLQTFLNNYYGELDRARAWKNNPNSHNVRNGQNHPKSSSHSPGNAGTTNASVAHLY